MRWYALLLLVLASRLVGAQAPDEQWRTLSTMHFRVHFPAGLDSLARRAAGESERAWTALAAELVPPRGVIEVIVTDNQDVSNGWATPFPTNRMAVFVRPPVDNPALRVGDDWLRFVITHELAHLFHLDRTRGLWRAAQAVFGRHPALFPHLQAPRWLVEGIAMHYERQAGGGRFDGSQLHATLGALDAAGQRPTPRNASLSTPTFPAGDVAYFGGARIIEAGIAAGGDSALRKFIEHGAGRLTPFWWDASARAGFGATFGTLAAQVSSPAPAPRPAGSVQHAAAWWDARAPRWRGDTVRFVATAPRQIPAVLDLHAGAVHWVARRNSVDAHGQAGVHAVYADLDFTDPFRLRSHLVRDERVVPGTAGARYASPDVRTDGTIVAVRTDPGGTSLVLVDADGERMLAQGSVDVQWSAPRWSRDGTRVAAVLWQRGGTTSIGVLSLDGAPTLYAAAAAVQQHPSWGAGDSTVVFASDRDGRMAVYAVSLRTDSVLHLVDGGAGVFDPEVSADGRALAALVLQEDGYHLLTMPMPTAGRAPTRSAAPREATPVLTDGGPSRRYSPWRSVLPRYWIPSTLQGTRGDQLVGFLTTGRDVVGRHAVGAQGLWDPRRGEFTGDASWRYSGFGVPALDVSAAQSWDAFGVRDSAGVALGEVARRNRIVSVGSTWQRPRVRTGAFVVTALELEWRDFRTDPAPLLARLDPLVSQTLQYPGAVLGVGWNNLMRAPLAISTEDGVFVAVTGRHRWRSDDRAATAANSVLADVRLFHSLPLPGHARHVLALRAVGGWGDRTLARPFSAGGVSGSSVEVLPGFRLGDAQRAFAVRGFAPGVQQGVRAWATSAEYRAPLPLVGRGAWPLPAYWQRSSVTLFGDAASAWCPPGVPSAGCPTGGTPQTTLASVGAELALDVSVDYDTPTRFRLGGAMPVEGAARRLRGYLSVGIQF
jgi:hypothetical protein